MSENISAPLVVAEALSLQMQRNVRLESMAQEAVAQKKQIAIGDRFGRLIIFMRATKSGQAQWHCLCDCGNVTTVRGSHLLDGLTTSCRCYQREQQRNSNTKHGHTIDGAPSPEYHAWRSMKERCLNPKIANFERYGGRGIKVCDRWLHSFQNFFSDIGRRPNGTSLDRYPDKNGNYEPSNVRWATPTEQSRNRRSCLIFNHQGKEKCLAEMMPKKTGRYGTTYSRIKKYGFSLEKALTVTDFRCTYYTLNGRTQCLKAWARECGINYGTLHARIYKRKWPLERAFESGDFRKK